MDNFFDFFKYKYFHSYFREIDNNFLFTDFSTISKFKPLPRIALKWIADPFLFEYEGKTYCFAEVASFSSGKGKIYVCCLDDKVIKWKKVISEKYHLSFPNVFEYEKQIYLMPESSEFGSVTLYRCVSFPKKWEKINEQLISDFMVDSVLSNSYKIYSYKLSDADNRLTMFGRFSVESSIKPVFSIIDKQNVLRPAGSIFKYNDKLILPTQMCTRWYGEGITFNFLNENTNSFSLSQFISIRPVDLRGFTELKLYGFHTYNKTSLYECIDVQFSKFKLAGLPLIIKSLFRKIFKHEKQK